MSASAGARAFSLISGMSVIVASVSNRVLATDTAFSSANSNDLDWIEDAALDQINILVASGIKAEIALARNHALDHHPPINT